MLINVLSKGHFKHDSCQLLNLFRPCPAGRKRTSSGSSMCVQANFRDTQFFFAPWSIQRRMVSMSALLTASALP